MYQTIQVSSCISIQGEFVETLASGEIIVRDGGTEYRGRPISRLKAGAAAPLIVRMDIGRAAPEHI